MTRRYDLLPIYSRFAVHAFTDAFKHSNHDAIHWQTTASGEIMTRRMDLTSHRLYNRAESSSPDAATTAAWGRIFVRFWKPSAIDYPHGHMDGFSRRWHLHRDKPMRFFSGWIDFVGPAIHVSLTPSFCYQKVEKGRGELEEDMKPDEVFGPPLTTSASRLCRKVLSFAWPFHPYGEINKTTHSLGASCIPPRARSWGTCLLVGNVAILQSSGFS
ncbi:hypothetical protein KC322_g65 [Hortaea werneckii]|nr:hypothetical protein KC322_g65 [Hortaea werneckii]